MKKIVLVPTKNFNPIEYHSQHWKALYIYCRKKNVIMSVPQI